MARENCERRKADEIFKRASASFARAEPDHRLNVVSWGATDSDHEHAARLAERGGTTGARRRA